MAYPVSLSSLRTQARERVGYENSTAVTDSELNTIINGELAELYLLILSCWGQDYYATPDTFVTVAGTEAYPLPDDFMQLLGVDLQLDGATYRKLQPYNFNERRAVSGFGRIPRYRLRGADLVLNPTPQAAYNGTIWYVPAPPTLGSDGDTFDCVGGWDKYIIAGACVSILAKEESDPSIFAAQKAVIAQQIRTVAPYRDAGDAPRIVDVYASNSWPEDDYGF